MLFIFLLIIIASSSKVPILNIPLPNCPYNTFSNTPESCTYNYNIIKNYSYICSTALVTISNCGNNNYVIFNLLKFDYNYEYKNLSICLPSIKCLFF